MYWMINCALEQKNLLEKDSGPVENSGYEKKKKRKKILAMFIIHKQ